jgi:hypothetical protein
VYDAYAHTAPFREPPARQRPALAVVLIAGLCAVHDAIGEYGIDIADLDSDHSLHTDPTVARIRGVARLLGDGVWIAVTIPGDYEGSESLLHRRRDTT